MPIFLFVPTSGENLWQKLFFSRVGFHDGVDELLTAMLVALVGLIVSVNFVVLCFTGFIFCLKLIAIPFDYMSNRKLEKMAKNAIAESMEKVPHRSEENSRYYGGTIDI